MLEEKRILYMTRRELEDELNSYFATVDKRDFDDANEYDNQLRINLACQRCVDSGKLTYAQADAYLDDAEMSPEQFESIDLAVRSELH